MSDNSLFSAFKLHSYTPNPTINSSSSAPEITPNPYCICAHCTHLFSFNIHHLGYVGDQGAITSSTRWSPTPAQLLYLEELYRQGTKTPTAQQIQQIASQLSRFGKIEAKNVFYWFQNHKARERQKSRRREIEISASSSSQDRKELHVMGLRSEKQSQQDTYQGLRGTGYEVKETKKWASTSNCSELAEVSDSLDIAERGAYRRTQSGERETQILRNKGEESQEAKCQNRDQMPYFPSNSNHLKNITTHTQTSNPRNYYDEEVAEDDRTLKLFPHKRDEDDDGICVTERENKFCTFNASVDSEITCSQFFEFLPLRN